MQRVVVFTECAIPPVRGVQPLRVRKVACVATERATPKPPGLWLDLGWFAAPIPRVERLLWCH